jgi:hypothetical protein
MAQCKGKTARGAACRNKAQDGSEFCKLHQDQAETSPPVTSDAPSSDETIKVADLITHYKQQGLNRLTVAMLDEWYPEIKGKSKTTRGYFRLSGEELALIRGDLEWGVAANMLRLQDQQAIKDWETPDPASIELIKHPDFTQAVYQYTGACGHLVQMLPRLLSERLENPNSKVSPLYRLCAECSAVRTSLLRQPRFAAKPDSECEVCHNPMFTRGAVGFEESRRDLWENVLSNVMGVLNLYKRLRPRHPDNHPEHLRLVRSADEFETWLERYKLEVGFAIGKHPEMGAELKAGMEDVIAKKAADLGISLEVS